MIRVALTLYLMLASATGPWLCCCTGARLLGCEAPPQGERGNDTPCSCGHHGQKNHAPPLPDKPVPDNPCPCQQYPVTAWALVTPEVSENGRNGSLVVPLSAEPPASVLASPCLLLQARADVLRLFPAHHFRDGRGILCALQILRC
jgi:hypothetical protein